MGCTHSGIFCWTFDDSGSLNGHRMSIGSTWWLAGWFWSLGGDRFSVCNRIMDLPCHDVQTRDVWWVRFVFLRHSLFIARPLLSALLPRSLPPRNSIKTTLTMPFIVLVKTHVLPLLWFEFITWLSSSGIHTQCAKERDVFCFVVRKLGSRHRLSMWT